MTSPDASNLAVLGQAMRHRLSEELFRRILFAFLCGLALLLVK